MRTMNALWGGPNPKKPACQGWRCSNCSWKFDMPFIYRDEDLADWETKARKIFDMHECAAFNKAQ